MVMAHCMYFKYLESPHLQYLASFVGPCAILVAQRNAEGLVCFLTFVTSRVEKVVEKVVEKDLVERGQIGAQNSKES